MPRTSTKTLLVAALSALLFAGCGSTPRTQVTLFVDADSVVRGETVSMRVEFFEPGNATAVYVETVPMTNWPVTFALIQDVQDEFVAHVYALDVGGQTVAEGVAWSSFVPRSTRFYYLFLERSPCTSAMIAACDADEVCQNGGTCAQVPFTPGTDLPAPPTEGENPDPCGLVTCGTDALCAVSAGAPVCRCPTGFAGDPEVSCVDVCSGGSAPDCGANGTCIANDAGSPACECDFPYTGALCDGCGTGWVLNGTVCEPACLGTCGTHEICNDQITVPACECAVGYGRLGPNCTWAGQGTNGGGFLDNQIADETAWNLIQTVIDDNEHGAGNGVAEPQTVGGCGEAELGQTIQMPSYSSAEPFVVEIGTERLAGEFDCAAAPMLRVGEAYARFDFTASPTMPPDRIGRACLPPGGYGPNVDIAIVADPYQQGFSSSTCFEGTAPMCEPDAIDSVFIRVANPGECPAPGTIVNGGFSGLTGWTQSASLNSAPGSASYSGGNLSVTLSRVCQQVTTSQRVTFPDESMLPMPALRFTSTATTGEPIVVSAISSGVQQVLVEPIGTGSQLTTTYCIPRWLQGTTATLQFLMSNGSGTCAINRPGTYTVDDVEFVTDASCTGDDTRVNFDDGNGGMRLYIPPANQSGTEPNVTPRPIFSTSSAGIGNLWVLNDNGATSVRATLLTRLPVDPTGAAGPMLRFGYRVTDTSSNARVTIQPSAEGSTQFVGTTASPLPTQSVCLPRGLAGEVVPLGFTFARTGGSALLHLVDDIEIVLDSGC